MVIGRQRGAEARCNAMFRSSRGIGFARTRYVARCPPVPVYASPACRVHVVVRYCFVSLAMYWLPCCCRHCVPEPRLRRPRAPAPLQRGARASLARRAAARGVLCGRSLPRRTDMNVGGAGDRRVVGQPVGCRKPAHEVGYSSACMCEAPGMGQVVRAALRPTVSPLLRQQDASRSPARVLPFMMRLFASRSARVASPSAQCLFAMRLTSRTIPLLQAPATSEMSGAASARFERTAHIRKPPRRPRQFSTGESERH